ncbi:MAG: MurR/RpiR family transcriptional regulator [Clostridium sp.]|nr:MurR/RpiR family transcriptional regulator [Clostridium sp.]
MNILMKIQEEYLRFAEQERKVADYILKNSDKIKNMKINILAKECGASTTTVTRFCKKMGCSSFTDLKFDIHESSVKKVIEKNNITDEVFNFYQTVIENTQNLIHLADLEIFNTILQSAGEIVVIGLSSSGVTANTLAVRLMRMGLRAQCISDVSWMRMKAKVIEPGTLVIAVSKTGTTKEVRETVAIAKANGAKIVSITSYTKNPIAELSDLAFYFYSTKFINDERFINSQFSSMYLIDVLTTYLLQDKRLNGNMKKTI